MTGTLIRRGKLKNGDMHREKTHTQEHHVTAEAQIEVMYLQAKREQSSLVTTRR